MDQSEEEITTWLDIDNYLVDNAPSQKERFTKEIRDHIERKGYPDPAPIQKQVLPFLLQKETKERFIYIKSPTGTGKTLSFILPPLFFFEDAYLENFSQDLQGKLQYYPYCLIMVNQHPLLRQIRDEFDQIIPDELKKKGLIVQHFDRQDIEANIRGQILCAVPDKINQFLQQSKIQLKNIRYVIIDEADNTIMNDNKKMVLQIVKKLMKSGNLNWKIIICGATINVAKLKEHFVQELGNEQEVKELQSFFDFKDFKYEIALDNIFHYYYPATTSENMQQILIEIIKNILEEFLESQIMVFFNEKVECESITAKIQQEPQLSFLVNNKKICEVKNTGFVERSEQQKIIEEFRRGDKTLMLCSDLMGRGMNFRKVRLVVNYGIPRRYPKGPVDPNRYDQRVGRTGRMEDLGVALTIFKQADKQFNMLSPNQINGQDYPETDILKDFTQRNITYEQYNPATFEQKMQEVYLKTKGQN